MDETLSPEADPRLFNATIVHSDAFREALRNFSETRKLPSPDENDPAWHAWDAACVDAYNAVVAVVDHYCALRVLTVLLVIHPGRPGTGG